MAGNAVAAASRVALGGDMAEQQAAGHVKWFDRKRGFGFIVPDDGNADILIHCSVVEEHDRRDLPEGATVECLYTDGPRGRHATRLLALDLSTAVESTSAPRPPRRLRPIDPSVPFVHATIKWFSRVRGYGFLEAEGVDGDVFVHMETLRDAGYGPAMPGDSLRVQVGAGAKGPMAIDIEPFEGSH